MAELKKEGLGYVKHYPEISESAGFRRNLAKNMAENADQYLVNKCFNLCVLLAGTGNVYFSKRITADQYFSGSADVPNASP